MVELWFGIAAVMLAAYVVLDGFDFGAGALHLYRRAERSPSGARCWRRSGRSGTATRCGCSPTGGALFVAFPRCSRRVCRGSTSRSFSCSGR